MPSKRVFITGGDVKPCPTCGDAHPGGIGVRICGCNDCFLLFAAVNEHTHLSLDAKARLEELRAMQS